MMDFLKANPHITKEAYLWEWTVPQIKLASFDSTRVEYSKNKSSKGKKNTSKTERQIETTKLDSLNSVQEWIRKNGQKSNI